MRISSVSIIALILASSLSCRRGKGASAPQEATITITQDSNGFTMGHTDLPEPNPGRASNKQCEVVGWGKSTPRAPRCYKVIRWAFNMDSPKWMYMLSNGDVLVAETKKEDRPWVKFKNFIMGRQGGESASENMNRIVLLRDTDKDGIPDMKKIFLENLNMPFGMLLLNGYFYVACTDGLWKYKYINDESRIISQGEMILQIPGAKKHWTRSLTCNEAGTKLYIGIGSSTDHAENGMEEEEHRACVIEVNPDGSAPKVYASGLRNPIGLAFYPGTDVLWTVVGERSGLGDGLVPDYMCTVRPDGFYGWPYSYFGTHLDPRVKADEDKGPLINSSRKPELMIGTHVDPQGLVFYDKRSFSPEYWNGAFIAERGAYSNDKLSGFKVVYVPFRNGRPVGRPVDFLTNFIENEKRGTVRGRPVGLLVMPNGSLLVADDVSNTIWQVIFTEEEDEVKRKK